VQNKERLLYMDGLKAFAAILVFNIHFLNAFYSGIYTLDPADFHTKAGIEWWIGATPLNLVYAGKLGARMFLGISAFLIVRNYYRSHNNMTPALFLVSTAKRYLKLGIPILVVNLFIVVGMRLGLYQNHLAANSIGPTEQYGVYNQFSPVITDAVKEALYGAFVIGSNKYNGPLWFIQYEFLGCMLISLILMVFGKRKVRYLCYLIFAVLFIRMDYLVMILCAFLADVITNQEQQLQRIFSKNILPGWTHSKKTIEVKNLLWFLIPPILYFATYPSYGSNLEGSIYTFVPPKVLFYYNVIIPVFLGVLYFLKPLQTLFDKNLLKRFNRISYLFYLVHFPILCMLSSRIFLLLYDKMNYHILAGMNYVVTIVCAIIVAWILTVLIYEPILRITEKLGKLSKSA